MARQRLLATDLHQICLAFTFETDERTGRTASIRKVFKEVKVGVGCLSVVFTDILRENL
jgi:hypothetical protein